VIIDLKPYSAYENPGVPWIAKYDVDVAGTYRIQATYPTRRKQI